MVDYDPSTGKKGKTLLTTSSSMKVRILSYFHDRASRKGFRVVIFFCLLSLTTVVINLRPPASLLSYYYPSLAAIKHSADDHSLQSKYPFIPSIVSLDDSSNNASQPDELRKLQQRLLTFYKTKIDRPLRVFVFPFHIPPEELTGDHKHCILDGVQRSPHLELVQNVTEHADVWMAHKQHRYAQDDWCQAFEPFYANTTVKTPFTNTARPPLFIMDYADWSSVYLPCRNLTTLSNQVHYLKRSIIQGRNFNDRTGWVNLGSVRSYDDWHYYSSSPVYYLPYPVRSDMIEAMERMLWEETNMTTFSGPVMNPSYSRSNKHIPPLLNHDIVHRYRPIDVAHFWPSPPSGKAKKREKPWDENLKVYFGSSQVRDRVSLLLDKLNNTFRDNNKMMIRTFTGFHGRPGEDGRVSAQEDYVRRLLDTKIVVVAQRDDWEAHHRLPEALISGACVFSDVMISLPQGYRDGESIVFYNSTSDLKAKILYYLDNPRERFQIALRGLELTFHRYRSWSLIEEAIFGRPL